MANDDRTAAVLTRRADDFPRWYQEVIARAGLAENGPVRGTMVIRPDGFALWERIRDELNARIVATGARNAYFPLLIPESYLRREAEHVAGFSPELAVVTHAGGKRLEEPLVIRPTSETVVGEYLAKWIDSYRDLPLALNQWANVVRWELRPRIFLRTTEFLWQEGHTAHASEADANSYARRILHEVYQDFLENVLAIPVVVGRKTAAERFAGATNTFTLEAMMADGKALQMGTSHELGQNFARAFDISYATSAGSREFAWTTSWGVSTRTVGGLIMCHGDDSGLRLPPRIAPIQVRLMAIKDETIASAERLAAELTATGLRADVDRRTDLPYGRRAVGTELAGIPVRVDVGPRELAEGLVTVVRRLIDQRSRVGIGAVVGAVTDALNADQRALYDEALARREAATEDVATVEDAIAAARAGWARMRWADLGEDGEARLAAAGVTVRVLTRPDGDVPSENDAPDLTAWLARSY